MFTTCKFTYIMVFPEMENIVYCRNDRLCEWNACIMAA